MSKDKFERLLYLSSVQLNQLDTEKIPVCFATGVLVDYCGKRLLLTVAHATRNNKNWSIQVKFVTGKGTQHYQLGAMNFLTEIALHNLTHKDIDFSYVEVPRTLVGYRQEIESLDIVKSETQITVHQTDLDEIPKTNKSYGFCGMVMPTDEVHFGHKVIGGELRVYTGLSYLRTNNNYHIFRLPFDHPGHEYFSGCSGAPVLSESGAIVGLVCKGCQETNEIYAISLRPYKVAIDILVGNIT